MRIRYLLFNAYAAGGTSRTIITQANALCDEHEVEIVSVYRHRERPHFAIDPRVTLRPLTDLRSDGHPRPGTEGNKGRALVRARRLPNPLPHRHDRRFRRWDPGVDMAVLRYLRSLRGGVLVTTRPGLNLLASYVVRRSVVRVGQEHMNLASHRPGLQRAIVRAYPRLDCVVTLTARDAQEYTEALSGTPVRITNVPNSVPAPRHPPAELEAPVVITAGRLTRQKGYDMLLEAFAVVADRHPAWELRIFGGGAKQSALKAQTTELGLDDRVRFGGVTPQLEKQLTEASLYVMSSRFEGFPMVLLEAMTVGLPVVSFDCPTGPAEILTHGHDGLLVPPNDVAGLAAAIEELINDPARRRALGTAAIETSQAYGADAVRTVWERLFTELASVDRGA